MPISDASVMNNKVTGHRRKNQHLYYAQGFFRPEHYMGGLNQTKPKKKIRNFLGGLNQTRPKKKIRNFLAKLSFSVTFNSVGGPLLLGRAHACVGSPAPCY